MAVAPGRKTLVQNSAEVLPQVSKQLVGVFKSPPGSPEIRKIGNRKQAGLGDRRRKSGGIILEWFD
jgi:hypothetical protein